MSRAVHSPPGRAGRLWLRDRLALAQRAVSLLDMKVRLLRRELDRADAVAAQSAAEWERACRQAQEWQQRVVVGGGTRSLRLNCPSERAEVVVVNTSVMGIGFPGSATVRSSQRSPDEAVIGGSAIIPAAAAFQRALQRGAECAVAAAGRGVLAAEVAATSQRLRALRDRWIPTLEATLSAVEWSLDELERTDSARLRWATGSQSPGGHLDHSEPSRPAR